MIALLSKIFLIELKHFIIRVTCVVSLNSSKSSGLISFETSLNLLVGSVSYKFNYTKPKL